MTQTTITTCHLCLAARRTIMSRWVLDPIPPARSTPTSNGLKVRTDSMDRNGPLPPSPLRQAMFAQGCTPPIILTTTHGPLSHHHIILILLTQVTRDQSRHTITIRKPVGKAREVMVALRAMFRLQGPASEGARLGTNTEPVEGVPENHLSAFRGALVVR